MKWYENLPPDCPPEGSKPIFQLDLTETDGLILQTGSDPHHFSWWRSVDFDLSNIKITKI
jgi:hypothetical protein